MLANAFSNDIRCPAAKASVKLDGSSAACTVATNGVSLAEAGDAVTAGEPVKVDSAGRVVNATRGTDIALYVGTAVTGSTALGQLVSVFLKTN